MAGKRYKYSFENKNHATKGVVSAVCAGISLGIFCVASLCSLAYHGNGGIYLGAMGLTALGISIYGFVMGLRSFSDHGNLAGFIFGRAFLRRNEDGEHRRTSEKADGIFAGSR